MLLGVLCDVRVCARLCECLFVCSFAFLLTWLAHFGVADGVGVVCTCRRLTGKYAECDTFVKIGTCGRLENVGMMRVHASPVATRPTYLAANLFIRHCHCIIRSVSSTMPSARAHVADVV